MVSEKYWACQNDLTSSLVQHYMYISQQDFNNININGQID